MNSYPNIKFNNDLIENKANTITYSGHLFQNNSDSVRIVYGYGENWNHTTEQLMEKTENGFVAQINILEGNTFNFCFRNSIYEWDNNNSQNYTAPISKQTVIEETEPSFIINENVITDILDNLLKIDLSEFENNKNDKIISKVTPKEEITTFDIVVEKNEPLNIEDTLINSVEIKALEQEIENIFTDIYSNKGIGGNDTIVDGSSDNGIGGNDDIVEVSSNNDIGGNDDIVEVSSDNDIGGNDDIVEVSSDNDIDGNDDIVEVSSDNGIGGNDDIVEVSSNNDIGGNDNIVEVSSDNGIGDNDNIVEVSSDNGIGGNDTIVEVSSDNGISGNDNNKEFDMNNLVDEVLSPIIKASEFEDFTFDELQEINIENNLSNYNCFDELFEDFEENDSIMNNKIDTLIADLFNNTKEFSQRSNIAQNSLENGNLDIDKESVSSNINIINNIYINSENDSQDISSVESPEESDIEEIIEDSLIYSYDSNNVQSSTDSTALIEIPNSTDFVVSPRALGKFYMFKKKVKLAFTKLFVSLPKFLSKKFNSEKN